jgi:hypothetical protein
MSISVLVMSTKGCTKYPAKGRKAVMSDSGSYASTAKERGGPWEGSPRLRHACPKAGEGTRALKLPISLRS